MFYKVEEFRRWARTQRRVTVKKIMQEFGRNELIAQLDYDYLKKIGVIGKMGIVKHRKEYGDSRDIAIRPRIAEESDENGDIFVECVCGSMKKVNEMHFGGTIYCWRCGQKLRLEKDKNEKK